MASDLKAVEEEVPGYYTLHFTKMPILNIVIMTLFYGVLAICLIKNYKKNVSLNTGLCLSLLFNSLLHYLYGNDSVYLYSQHFLLAALNLLTNKKENQKILQKFLTVFLLIQCVVNFMRFGKVHELLNKYMVRTFWSNTFSTITLIIIFTLVFIITILLLWFIYRNMKNLINKKDNKMYYAFIIIISLCLLNGLFVALQTTQTYQKIGFIDLNLIKK